MSDTLLNNYIDQCRKAGFDNTEIKGALLDAGWLESDIDNALDKKARKLYLLASVAAIIVLLFITFYSLSVG